VCFLFWNGVFFLIVLCPSFLFGGVQVAALLEKRAKVKEMTYDTYEFDYLPTLRVRAEQLVDEGTCSNLDQVCCNALQHTATSRNTLQHPAAPCNTQQLVGGCLLESVVVCIAVHCNVLQDTAIHRLVDEDIRCGGDSEKHCIILQHTAPARHCRRLHPNATNRYTATENE